MVKLSQIEEYKNQQFFAGANEHNGGDFKGGVPPEAGFEGAYPLALFAQVYGV